MKPCDLECDRRYKTITSENKETGEHGGACRAGRESQKKIYVNQRWQEKSGTYFVKSASSRSRSPGSKIYSIGTTICVLKQIQHWRVCNTQKQRRFTMHAPEALAWIPSILGTIVARNPGLNSERRFSLQNLLPPFQQYVHMIHI
jgi:hypothetical protein